MTPEPNKPVSSEGLQPYSGPKKPYVPVNLNFAGVQGSDRFSIHTPEGAKWMKLGQVANGYLLSGYNSKTKELQVTQKGRHYIVPMNAGTPEAYTPPSSSLEHPYTTDPTEFMMDDVGGEGTTSDFEQELLNSFMKRGMTADEAKSYNIAGEDFDSIYNNAQKSTYMTPEQKNNIYSLDAYYKNLEARNLKAGENYYIPRRDSNGVIDFDIFSYREEGE